MDRGEFLSILRESLEGYIPMEDVERNIEEYRNYFKDSGKSDKELIQELGDPRLIARTIIDAYRASKGPMADFYEKQARSEYSKEHSDVYEDGSEAAGSRWFGGITAGRVAFFIILLVIIIGLLILVGIVAVYALPVIFVIWLIKYLVDNAGRR